MMRSSKALHLPLIFVLALLAFVVLVVPVYAQDVLPADPVPVNEPAPVEEPPAPEVAPVDAPVVAADTTTSEVVSAADFVDPWFKIGTTTYSYVNIANAVTAVSTGLVPTDGLIHVDEGTLHNQGVTINGTNPYLNALKGITGHVDPDTLAPDAILDNTLNPGSFFYVINKTNGFILSGFDISGKSGSSPPDSAVVEFISNAGPIVLQDLVVFDAAAGTGNGIRVAFHNGTIMLKNVISNDNPGGGAVLNNSLGTGSVTVTNSSFDDNDGGAYATGLHIISKGAVTINGVSASGNITGVFAGIQIDSSAALIIKNTIVNGNNIGGIRTGDLTAAITLENVTADKNFGDGLWLVTKGNISLKNVSSSGNSEMGAWLDTCAPSSGLCTWLGTGTATINGGTFDGNKTQSSDNVALWIVTRGAITLTNVSASDNNNVGFAATGAVLDTSQSQLISPVTINVGNFNGNRQAGLEILAKGAIKLTSVNASGNSFTYGANLVNVTGTAGVTITGIPSVWSDFDSNGSFGLNIETKGAISLSYVECSGNLSGRGATLTNSTGSGSVTIIHGLFNSNIGGDGLNVVTRGAITLTSSGAFSNSGGYGVQLVNSTAPSAMPITVKDGGYNGNALGGAVIESKGAILLNNIVAGASPGLGMQLMNIAGTASITIINSDFSSNISDGLFAFSKGAVTLLGVSANGSATGTGAYILNTGGTGPVSVTNSSFSGNGHRGLQVDSKGAITLTSVTANSNVNSYGARLTNTTGTSGITVNNGFFNGNHLDGVQAFSNGAIKLLNVTSNGSSLGNGALLTNIAGTAGVTVTNSTFNSNQISGLDVITKGLITLATVTANSNLTGKGASLVNSAGTAGVTSSNGSFNGNLTNGFYVDSKGAIKLTSITANSNGDTGIYLVNTNPLVPQPVTGTSLYASGNKYVGLGIASSGAITITNGTFDGNHAQGGLLVNSLVAIFKKPVTITGATFDGNGSAGVFDNLQIYTYAGVTLKSVSADSCITAGCNGLALGVITPISGNVSITNSSFDSNQANGLYVRATGTLLLSGISANNNYSGGAVLNNQPGLPAKPVITVTNGEFNGNSSGLVVYSSGNATLTNIIANDNVFGNGAFVQSAAGNVSLLATGTHLNSFFGNLGGFDGLEVETTGNVVLNKVYASNNTSGAGVMIGDLTEVGNITINTGEMDNNILGLVVYSMGTITVNGVTANNNPSGGIYLDNSTDHSGLKTVTINKCTANSNIHGLTALSWGQITVNNATAIGNSLDGFLLNNGFNTLLAPKGVAVLNSLGANSFNGNMYGLRIVSRGAIGITGVTADENTDNGILLNETSVVDPVGAITLNNVTTRRNTHSGIYINAAVPIVATNITSLFNSAADIWDGITILSHDHAVTISNSVFMGNGRCGIVVGFGAGSTAPLKLTNVLYFGNMTFTTAFGNLLVSR